MYMMKLDKSSRFMTSVNNWGAGAGLVLFAMAKIRRIGHDHQAPFLVLLGISSVTRGENKLPHAQYTPDPQYFYRFWTPYKMTIRGAD